MKRKHVKTMMSGLLLTLTLMLTACGGTEADSTTGGSKGNSTNKGTVSSVEAPRSENEIVVKVGDVEIPICSTWEELAAIAAENGWEVDEKLIPDPINEGTKKAYNKKGGIVTPEGEILICLMPNADVTGAEVEYIALAPFYLEDQEASILGITPETDIKEIAEKYELIEEDSEVKWYKVDEYVKLKVSLDAYEGKNTVTIMRIEYADR